jgi:hypothetical protein
METCAGRLKYLLQSPASRQSLRRHFTDAGTGAGRQTDFLIHISVFHFPSLRSSFIIAEARGGRAMVYDKRKMEDGK